MVLFLGKPMKHAVGTSLLVIALNCAVAAYGHRSALHMQWSLLAQATAAALTGMLGGVVLSRRFAAHSLRRAFAVFVLLLGLLMVARNASSILP
jgi:hypothetical protein